MTRNAQQYQQEVLDATVIPRFDNYPLATRPIFMDDNVRPHRCRVVIAHLRINSIETLPCPTWSPDLNPVEPLWDYLGRQVQARDPPVRNLQELEQALNEEWQRIPLEHIRRLVASMRRWLTSYVRREDTPDTDASVSDGLVKHVYSLFKNNEGSNLVVWLFLTILLWVSRISLSEYSGNIANKVSSKLKLPFIFVSVTSTNVDSHLVKTI